MTNIIKLKRFELYENTVSINSVYMNEDGFEVTVREIRGYFLDGQFSYVSIISEDKSGKEHQADFSSFSNCNSLLKIGYEVKPFSKGGIRFNLLYGTANMYTYSLDYSAGRYSFNMPNPRCNDWIKGKNYCIMDDSYKNSIHFAEVDMTELEVLDLHYSLGAFPCRNGNRTEISTKTIIQYNMAPKEIIKFIEDSINSQNKVINYE